MLKCLAPYAFILATSAGLAYFATLGRDAPPDDDDVIQTQCGPTPLHQPGELRMGLSGRSIVIDANRADRLRSTTGGRLPRND